MNPTLSVPLAARASGFALLITIAISIMLALAGAVPAAAQWDDGTTIPDFVLDSAGLPWFKVKPVGAKSLKPDPQVRFIADKGNDRGGNAVHPDFHWIAEDAFRDARNRTGSDAKFEIRWVDGTGLAGGYQIIVTSDRGQNSLSLVTIALWRMKLGRVRAGEEFHRHFNDVL